MSMSSNSTRPCYTWGSTEPSWNFTACKSDEAYSMCCRPFSIEGQDYSPDSCLPNGMCSYYANSIDQLADQWFMIEACSDPTWQSEACAPFVKYMKGDTGTGCFINDFGIARLGFCPHKNTYCCNQDYEIAGSTDCCDPKKDHHHIVHIPIASMVQVTTSFDGKIYTTVLPTLLSTSTPDSSPTITTNTQTGSVTRGPSATGNTTLRTTNDDSLSVGAAVGLGIGATAGSIILFTLAFLMWRRRRTNYARSHEIEYAPDLGQHGGKGFAELNKSSVAEVHGFDRRYELSNNAHGSGRHELR